MNKVADGGEAILEAFRNLGIDYVFSSPGSDWGSVWEAFARQKVEDTRGPCYVSCAHETLAVDLAIGYTAMTGRMQAVLLHAGHGLMQGSMGIYGALTLEIPLIVMSGESLTYGDEEGFDPGPQWYGHLSIVGGPQRLVEPFVKWGNQATSAATLYEMVIRAGEMAQRSPRGPTYLNVPIETMLHSWSAPRRMRKVPPAPKPCPSTPDVARVAQLLLAAENPVITTESCAREPQGYEALLELAELLAIPIIEGAAATVSNFPKDHPLHQGFDIRPMLEEADLVVVIRSRVPWYPPNRGPASATVVVIDEYPFKTHMVYQNLQADVFLEGDVPSSLRMLSEAVRAARLDTARTRARRTRWEVAHLRIEEGCRSAESKARLGAGVHALHLCTTLGEVLPADAIYVDETILHRRQIQRFVPYQGPQSFFRVSIGLGQCLGVALGIKLASPDRPVIALVGDGGLLYNPVPQSLAFAKESKLPIMIVVFNNGGYKSMTENQLSYYPDGAGARHRIFYGETLNGPNYDELVRPFGGVGIRVSDPADLKPALEEAYAALKSGRIAIVNVLLDACVFLDRLQFYIFLKKIKILEHKSMLIKRILKKEKKLQNKDLTL